MNLNLTNKLTIRNGIAVADARLNVQLHGATSPIGAAATAVLSAQEDVDTNRELADSVEGIESAEAVTALAAERYEAALTEAVNTYLVLRENRRITADAGVAPVAA